MGDKNQELFLKKFAGEINGPVLEIGSKDYGNTVDFRSMFPNSRFVGVDLETGKGVDAVVDFSTGIGDLVENQFGLCICCSVMEHCAKPWVMAENMTSVLAPGGKMFVSVPWVWAYHPYPDDFFRFSYSGIKAIFPQIHWDNCYYSTKQTGVFYPCDDPTIDSRLAMIIKPKNPKDRPGKFLPSMMVNAIGRKKS